VLPDADLDLAATAAWFGVLLNHGQTCMAARRLFIAEAVYEPFLERLKSLMDAAEVQHLVMPASVEQAGRAIADAQERGGQLVCGMPAPTGSSMLPTIVLNATPEMIICREPSFAPIAAVMSFSDQEMALQMEAQCPYALAASIFTRDIRSAERLAARLRPGAVCINDVVAPTAHPATPFGGRGASGWGVTQGAEGLLGMTVPQVVSTRTDTFRPYYTIGSMPEPGMPDVVEGAFIWQHARTFGERWRGLRQMLRGMWQMSRK